MILMHIITTRREQALEIITILMENKLLCNTILSRKKSFEIDAETGKLKSAFYTLVIGKTKSQHFNSINNLLVLKYGNTDTMPSLYCLPIIHPNTESTEGLLTHKAQVD